MISDTGFIESLFGSGLYFRLMIALVIKGLLVCIPLLVIGFNGYSCGLAGVRPLPCIR